MSYNIILFSGHPFKLNLHSFIYKMHSPQLIHQAVTAGVPFILPANYGYVLIVAAVIALEILLIGFIFPGRVRGTVFTEEFMKQNFGAEHKTATGFEIAKGGYPDMGTGLYSQRLSYKDWYAFNNAQRVHGNFIEMAPSTFVWLLIAGLYFPIPAAAIGLGVFFARLIYSIGYSGEKGPQGRIFGALLNDLFLLGLFGLSIASGALLINGNGAI